MQSTSDSLQQNQVNKNVAINASDQAGGVKITADGRSTNQKPIIFRKTDYTDQIRSDIGSSQIMNKEGFDKISHNLRSKYAYLKDQRQNDILGIQGQIEKQEKIVELRERLRNVHHFYKIRIEEERNKNLERSQIFLGIIQQLQQIHNQKIANSQKKMEEMETGKQELGQVDERVNNIRGKIQQIISQSNDLKIRNKQIEEQIYSRNITIKQNQQIVYCKRQQLNELRGKLQQFQRLKLKENRRKKQMIQIIDGFF